jgi:hypothetical protein
MRTLPRTDRQGCLLRSSSLHLAADPFRPILLSYSLPPQTPLRPSALCSPILPSAPDSRPSACASGPAEAHDRHRPGPVTYRQLGPPVRRRRRRSAARSRAGVRGTRKGSIAWGGAPSRAHWQAGDVTVPTVSGGRLGPDSEVLGPGPRVHTRAGVAAPADPFASGRHWLDSNASVQFGIGTSLVLLVKVPSDGPCSESAENFYVDPMSRASGARDSSDQPYNTVQHDYKLQCRYQVMALA